MARPVKPAARARIQEMYRGGMTEREIAAEVGCSKTTVHHIVVGRGGVGALPLSIKVPPAPPAESAPSAEPAPPAPSRAVLPAGPPPPPPCADAACTPGDVEPLTDAEVVTAMRRAVSETARYAEQARGVGDVRAAALWGRLMSQTACELRKYLGSHETDPDDAFGAQGEEVRNAAAAARAKLIAGLARVEEIRATWPKCATCGQPIKPAP